MRHLILTGLFCVCACSDKSIEEPQNLLSEKQMENILYDMALLQTMSSVTSQPLQENGIDVKTYIYNKYKIDSLTLVQNQRYYAGDLEKYQKIHKTVVERLKAQKAPFDSINPGDQKLKRMKIAPSANATVQ